MPSASGIKSCFRAAPLFVMFIILMMSGCRSVPPHAPPVATPGHKAMSKGAYEIDGHWYVPLPSAHGFTQTGIASWYGHPFDGRKTASGEIYDMYGPTAAHKILPLGTMVLVRNLRNGKKTVVRINDRGPFVRGRIIDLSYEAARKLGMARRGTAPVKIVALEGEKEAQQAASNPHFHYPDFNTGDFTVQIGAFSHHSNAVALKKRMSRQYHPVEIVPYDKNGTTFYRVRVGRFTSLKMAEAEENQLVRRGFPNAFAVSRD